MRRKVSMFVYFFTNYMPYVFVHKWYVLQGCREAGILWRGIIHDWSKFRPREFVSYSAYFYATERKEQFTRREMHGIQVAFDVAWNAHIHSNDHHWQYWILHQDDGDMKYLRMTNNARKELLADWRGTGKALGNPDTASWYTLNSKGILFDHYTRVQVEIALGIREKG